MDEMDQFDHDFIPNGLQHQHITCFLVEKGNVAELSLVLDSYSNNVFIIVESRAVLTYIRHAISSCRHSDNLKLKEGAMARVRFTQNENSNVFFNQSAFLENKAILNSGAYWCSGGIGLNTTNLIGNYSSTEHVDVCYLRESYKLKLDTIITHAAATRCNVLMKGVVRDNAKAYFNGNIKIGKQSGRVTAHMEQAMLLLNKGAYAEAKPFLEIENNDVQCSHSAYVKEIDKEQVFYLMSRGLSEKEAKQRILEGFLESGMEKMRS